MSIPALNQFKLLPAGVHECSFDEIASRFVYTSERQQIWDRFLDYFNLIKDFREIQAIYVDGSFVTDIKTPSDLDIAIEFVSFYDWGRLKRSTPQLFDEVLIKKKWLLDCLPCAPEIMSWQTDYRAFFQELSARDIEKLGLPKGVQKGVLVVRLRGQE